MPEIFKWWNLPAPIEDGRLRWASVPVFVALPTLLNLWMFPLTGGRAPFVPLFPAVVAAAYFAGPGPGFATLLLSAVTFGRLWLTPSGVSWLHETQGAWILLVFFSVTGSLVVAIGAQARGLLLASRLSRA